MHSTWPLHCISLLKHIVSTRHCINLIDDIIDLVKMWEHQTLATHSRSRNDPLSAKTLRHTTPHSGPFSIFGPILGIYPHTRSVYGSIAVHVSVIVVIMWDHS